MSPGAREPPQPRLTLGVYRMSSFWAHLSVKLENCQTLRALIKLWNIQIIHLAVKAAQNHHRQLHSLLAPRLRASGSSKRGGMFPVQHAQRENAFSKHRSRTLIPTCLLQLQFLCAQHHLECGHWQTRTWPVIKTLPCRVIALSPTNALFQKPRDAGPH